MERDPFSETIGDLIARYPKLLDKLCYQDDKYAREAHEIRLKINTYFNMDLLALEMDMFCKEARS